MKVALLKEDRLLYRSTESKGQMPHSYMVKEETKATDTKNDQRLLIDLQLPAAHYKSDSKETTP